LPAWSTNLIADVLPQIDDIFFATSAVQTLRDDQHRASFRMRWLAK
jgi:hypothetical protein